MSLELETRYSKQEILDAYLNSAYFGAGPSVCEQRASVTSGSRL